MDNAGAQSFLQSPLAPTTLQGLVSVFQSRQCYQKMSEINPKLQTQVKGESVPAGIRAPNLILLMAPPCWVSSCFLCLEPQGNTFSFLHEPPWPSPCVKRPIGLLSPLFSHSTFHLPFLCSIPSECSRPLCTPKMA